MQRKPLCLPVCGSAKTSRPVTRPFRFFSGADFQFLSLLYLFLMPAAGSGQGSVRVVEQKFDFREFRFDITLQSSDTGLQLLKVGFFNFIELCDKVPISNAPDISVKSVADYRISMPWKHGNDTVLTQASPVLALPKNKMIRFTLGVITQPTVLLAKGCIQLTSRPVLVFSDGARLVLEEIILDSRDFIDYSENSIPDDLRLQEDAISSNPDIRSEAAWMLGKSDLPKTILRPIIDSLLDDPDEWVRRNAIISAGRLRFTEYTERLRKHFIATGSVAEARASLRTLKTMGLQPLAPLVAGRLDTSRMERMVDLCCQWLEKNDREKYAYQQVVNKLSGKDSLDVKLACIPLVNAWKIREAGESLLALITQPGLYSSEVRQIAEALVSIDDTVAAAKALELLHQQRYCSSLPQGQPYCEALLRVVAGYNYQPALALFRKLLQPDQPVVVSALTLNVLLRQWKDKGLNRMKKTLPDVNTQVYFEALKPSILNLITHPQEEVRKKAFNLYCYIAKSGDTPSREGIIQTFLKSRSVVDLRTAIDVISDLNLQSLAPDLCELLRKTTDVSFRSRLEDVLNNALNYSCP